MALASLPSEGSLSLHRSEIKQSQRKWTAVRNNCVNSKIEKNQIVF